MWRFQQPLSGLSRLAKSNVLWLLLATLWQQSSRKCSTTPDEKLLGKTAFTVTRPRQYRLVHHLIDLACLQNEVYSSITCYRRTGHSRNRLSEYLYEAYGAKMILNGTLSFTSNETHPVAVSLLRRIPEK
jgi:hypothetical protein